MATFSSLLLPLARAAARMTRCVCLLLGGGVTLPWSLFGIMVTSISSSPVHTLQQSQQLIPSHLSVYRLPQLFQDDEGYVVPGVLLI